MARPLQTSQFAVKISGMERALTIFIWLWMAAQAVANLALAWWWRDADPLSGYGPTMFMDGLRLIGSRTAMGHHLVFLAGNLVLAVPAMGAALWRDRVRAMR